MSSFVKVHLLMQGKDKEVISTMWVNLDTTETIQREGDKTIICFSRGPGPDSYILVRETPEELIK